MDSQDDTAYMSMRERLAANNKLWAACLIAVLAASVILISSTNGGPGELPARDLREDPVGVYTDSDHREFVAGFRKMALKRGVDVEAKFLSDKTFKLVLPCDVSSDEISFLSRSAAVGIWRLFKASPVIWTYLEDNNRPEPVLVARTSWSRARNDFIVRFERVPGSE